MARKFKDFVERDKPRKRPRRHCKSPNKKKKLQHNKKYNRQGRTTMSDLPKIPATQKKLLNIKEQAKYMLAKADFDADVADPNTDTTVDDFRQDLEIKVTKVSMGAANQKIMQPRGATEIQMEMLNKHVSKELLDQVQICTSIPGKVPIDPNKLNILWQKNSWDQPNLQEFFTNKKDMKNMIGMYLIVIGIMKSLDMLLIYLLKNL